MLDIAVGVIRLGGESRNANPQFISQAEEQIKAKI